MSGVSMQGGSVNAPAAGGVACNDGIDNDGDGTTDYPADFGCWGAADTDEKFPDATNTGVPSGTSLTATSGRTITVNGTTIDAEEITGRLTIAADNVTVKRSRVTSSGGAYHGIIWIDTGSTGTLIEDVEVTGSGNVLTCIYSSDDAVTVRRANVHSCEDGIELRTGSTIEYSYIHDLLCGGNCGGDPHYDGIEQNGGQSNVTIFHNTIDLDEYNATATTQINDDRGPQTNIVIDSNLLIGAGYTAYRDSDFDVVDALDVDYTNNFLLPCPTNSGGDGCSTTGGWHHGSCLDRGNGTLVWTNNRSIANGGTIACLTQDPPAGTLYECADGVDNDFDGNTDWAGGDTGCQDPSDRSEVP